MTSPGRSYELPGDCSPFLKLPLISAGSWPALVAHGALNHLPHSPDVTSGRRALRR